MNGHPPETPVERRRPKGGGLPALLSLAGKELRQTFRDRRVAALLVIAPVVQLVVLGYAVELQVDHVRTVAADEDRTAESRGFVSGLLAGDAFSDVGRYEDAAAAMDLLTRGEATVAVVVPRGFGRRLSAGDKAMVQLLVDGGDSNRALIAQAAAVSYGMQQAIALAGDRLRSTAAARGSDIALPTLRVEPRVFYNPTLSSKVYFVPGVAATLLIIVTLITTAMGLSRETESGTLEQVLVTPIGPNTFILGKTLPYAAIGLLDLFLVVGVGSWLFDVPVRGALPLLALGGLLYLLTTLGLGLLIATLVRTQQQAFFGAFFFVMPGILLSGFITPVENMPAWLRPLTVLNPVRHFVEVMRAVLLKAASIEEIASQLVALLGLGVAIFASAALLLRRKLA